MLPAAPPTAWAATIVSGDATPMVSPVLNWNRENIMFDTVLEPAAKAPRAPIHGARSGQLPPVALAAASARAIGMESRPLLLNSMPELMKIRTSGNAKDRKSTRLNSSHVAISYAVF